MSWEIVGSTGEWAGALVVAFTLIYLSIQIRQQNRISQYEAWASIIDGLNQNLISSTPENVMTYMKGRNSPSDCDDVELMLFQTGLRIYANNTQKAFRAYKYGFLSEEDWLIQARVFAAEVNTPGGKLWREGNENSAPDFFLAVDQAGGELTAELDLRAGAARS
jgi:hypothetical protein